LLTEAPVADATAVEIPLSPALSLSALVATSSWSLDEVEPSLTAADFKEVAAVVQAVTTVQPRIVTESQPSSSVQPRRGVHTAPCKDITKQAAIQSKLRSWPSMPLVSTADLYAVARAIPEATPMEMAEAVVQLYDLDDKVKNRLYRRLAAITYTRVAVRSELRSLLPICELNKDSAMEAFEHLYVAC